MSPLSAPSAHRTSAPSVGPAGLEQAAYLASIQPFFSSALACAIRCSRYAFRPGPDQVPRNRCAVVTYCLQACCRFSFVVGVLRCVCLPLYSPYWTYGLRCLRLSCGTRFLFYVSVRSLPACNPYRFCSATLAYRLPRAALSRPLLVLRPSCGLLRTYYIYLSVFFSPESASFCYYATAFRLTTGLT